MFHFKGFSLSHQKSTLKIGTDSVLLASLIPEENATRILDIGCGCGVVAFCVAYKLHIAYPEIKHTIIGIDIDADSIIEAQQNCENLAQYPNLEFSFQHKALQEFQTEHKSEFDLIVSNPPYFVDSLKPTSANNNKSKHRDENLSFKELIDGCCTLLSAEGRFYLILPPEEYADFKREAHGKLYPFSEWEIFPTPTKKANRIIAGFKLYPSEEIDIQQLYIRDENHQFAEEYKNMTKIFYL